MHASDRKKLSCLPLALFLMLFCCFATGRRALAQSESSAWGPSIGIPLAIPDSNPAGITSDLVFGASDYGVISELMVALEVNHAWVGDLIVTLQHTDTGTTVTLVDQITGNGTTTCQANNLNNIIADSGSSDIQSACPAGDVAFPTFVFYRPPESLSTFNGEHLTGTWRLRISDRTAGITGTLVSWSVVHYNANLALTASSSRDNIAAGASYQYWLDVLNDGPRDATEAGGRMLFPETLTYLGAEGAGGLTAEYNSGDRIASATVPTLGAAQTMRVIFNARPVNPPPPLIQMTILSPAAIAGEYSGGEALFGPDPATVPAQAEVVVANDGSGVTSDGCQALVNGAQVSGRIALIDRGTCTFATKAKRAQDAGAVGVIIANTTNSLAPMAASAEEGSLVTIPCLMQTLADGAAIKAALGSGASVTARLAKEVPQSRWRIVANTFAISTSPGSRGSTSTLITVLADGDNDGVANVEDACPADPLKGAAGVCGCGTPDTDTDSDGTPNCNDQCASDPAKTAPGVCGCGTGDTDTDADGTPVCNDQCPADPAKTAPGSCGCGVADTDSDFDGTSNCHDQCAADPAKTAGGTCGCGTAETDSDGDQTADCNDQCPSNASKVHPGVCGCAQADSDQDNDRIIDCRYADELKSYLTRVSANLRGVTPTTNRTRERQVKNKVNAVKAYLTRIQTLVAGHASGVTFSGGNIQAATQKLLRSVRVALAWKSPGFKKNMGAAKKALAAYRGKVA